MYVWSNLLISVAKSFSACKGPHGTKAGENRNLPYTWQTPTDTE